MAQHSALATYTFLKHLREEVDGSPGAEALASIVGSTDSLAKIWARCPRADWLLAILDRAVAVGLVRRSDLADPLRLFACECARSVAGAASCRPGVGVAERYVRGEASIEDLTAAGHAAGPGACGATTIGLPRYFPEAGVQLAAYATTYGNALAAAIHSSRFAAFAVVSRAGEAGVKQVFRDGVMGPTRAFLAEYPEVEDAAEHAAYLEQAAWLKRLLGNPFTIVSDAPERSESHAVTTSFATRFGQARFRPAPRWRERAKPPQVAPIVNALVWRRSRHLDAVIAAPPRPPLPPVWKRVAELDSYAKHDAHKHNARQGPWYRSLRSKLLRRRRPFVVRDSHGLGWWLAAVVLGLKRAVFVIVNVPAGIWVLAHGYVVPGTAMLGVGLGTGITLVEPFIAPLPRWLEKAWGWTLGVGGAALVILFVQLALGYYPPPPPAVHQEPPSRTARPRRRHPCIWT